MVKMELKFVVSIGFRTASSQLVVLAGLGYIFAVGLSEQKMVSDVFGRGEETCVRDWGKPVKKMYLKVIQRKEMT